MDPALLSDANALLRAHGLRPRKSWGQNFLCDRNVIDRIVRAADLDPEDRTLEIGAGLGSLTRSLADSCANVTTVEIDRLLDPILRETLASRENVTLVFEDFLKADLDQLMTDAFRDRPGVVVASIPYYISSPILERLLERKSRLSRVVMLTQAEFAARLAAAPDTEEYGALSVFAQFHARVEVVGKVSRHVFMPQPEVGSAIVRLDMVQPATVAVPDEEAFFRIVRAAFGQRRKTLSNALSSRETGRSRAEAEALLARAGIDAGRRGETLSLDEFARLASA
jgi:16S rRNA (adenine1518-N6/adenine1519-N6)-dimethyltransferase